jgi:hypothetical protein
MHYSRVRNYILVPQQFILLVVVPLFNNKFDPYLKYELPLRERIEDPTQQPRVLRP